MSGYYACFADRTVRRSPAIALQIRRKTAEQPAVNPLHLVTMHTAAGIVRLSPVLAYNKVDQLVLHNDGFYDFLPLKEVP